MTCHHRILPMLRMNTHGPSEIAFNDLTKKQINTFLHRPQMHRTLSYIDLSHVETLCNPYTYRSSNRKQQI